MGGCWPTRNSGATEECDSRGIEKPMNMAPLSAPEYYCNGTKSSFVRVSFRYPPQLRCCLGFRAGVRVKVYEPLPAYFFFTPRNPSCVQQYHMIRGPSDLFFYFLNAYTSDVASPGLGGNHVSVSPQQRQQSAQQRPAAAQANATSAELLRKRRQERLDVEGGERKRAASAHGGVDTAEEPQGVRPGRPVLDEGGQPGSQAASK